LAAGFARAPDFCFNPAVHVRGSNVTFEIERKFLIVGDGWQKLAAKSVNVRQAYLALESDLSFRVRIKDGSSAQLTIKSRGAELRRSEFEYPIPVQDAEMLMSRRRGSIVAKVRHEIPWGGLTWEIDVFAGDNAGLIIAEIELRHEQQAFEIPDWIGVEVTGQRGYYNSALAIRPFCMWSGHRDGERVA
jgi:adenylate cyclase